MDWLQFWAMLESIGMIISFILTIIILILFIIATIGGDEE